MNKRSPITTHALDLARGKPAADLPVHLEFQVSDRDWKSLKKSKTNADGRIEDLLEPDSGLKPGVYRLTFDTDAYFRGAQTFYPAIVVTFKILAPQEHYHVPLLLNSFGYSTYRGT